MPGVEAVRERCFLRLPIREARRPGDTHVELSVDRAEGSWLRVETDLGALDCDCRWDFERLRSHAASEAAEATRAGRLAGSAAVGALDLEPAADAGEGTRVGVGEVGVGARRVSVSET